MMCANHTVSADKGKVQNIDFLQQMSQSLSLSFQTERAEFIASLLLEFINNNFKCFNFSK